VIALYSSLRVGATAALLLEPVSRGLRWMQRPQSGSQPCLKPVQAARIDAAKTEKTEKTATTAETTESRRTEGADFDMRGNRYWVPINGTWMPVPHEAVLTGVGNPVRDAVVWYSIYGDQVIIRCFVPGGGV
jgi:hypothetical protein